MICVANLGLSGQFSIRAAHRDWDRDNYLGGPVFTTDGRDTIPREAD
jgi:hypothetical protein